METSRYLRVIVVLAMVLGLQGCLSKFRVETDRVLGTSRIRVNMEFKRAVERRNPLINLQKSVTKEKNINSVITYQVFGILDLDRSSFGLRNEILIIIDQTPHVIFPEIIDSSIAGLRIVGSASNNDGQTTSDFPGKRTYRINYLLEDGLIEKIRVAGQVHFRYYAGPDVITIKLSRSDLRNFVRMITQII